MSSTQASQRAFYGVSALLFAASAAATIVRCFSRPAMRAMAICGDGAMSMVWMRMPGESWAHAATSFLLMWIVMMAAMMLPSLTPMLERYRRAVARSGETSLG